MTVSSVESNKDTNVEVNTTTPENNNSEKETNTGSLNGREVEAKEHEKNAQEKIVEYAKDCIKASAVIGGATASAAPIVPVAAAAVIIIDGSKKLVEACQEYNEAKRIENEAKGLDIFGNPLKIESDNSVSSNENNCDRENDRDSWDREY